MMRLMGASIKAFWIVAVFGFVGTSFAAGLKCNKTQTICVVASNDLGIGDKVGVFNSERELVATGVVDKLKGQRRTVKIKKNYGTIRMSDRLALLQAEQSTLEKTYTVYKPTPELSVGGGIGLASFQVGDGSPATDFSVLGIYRKWYDIDLIGRGHFMVMEGEISRTTLETGFETVPISMSGFGLLVGAGKSYRLNKPVGFRGEIDLGIFSADATVDGDSSLVSDQGFDTRIRNGIGPFFRTQAGVLWNMKSWHFEAAGVYSLVHNAHVPAFQATILKDID